MSTYIALDIVFDVLHTIFLITMFDTIQENTHMECIHNHALDIVFTTALHPGKILHVPCLSHVLMWCMVRHEIPWLPEGPLSGQKGLWALYLIIPIKCLSDRNSESTWAANGLIYDTPHAGWSLLSSSPSLLSLSTYSWNIQGKELNTVPFP